MEYLLNPTAIQFEISSNCNLLCLGCVRTDPNTFNNAKSFINNNKLLSKETFFKIISAPEFVTVNKLDFCGTIDDPLTHPDFLTMLEMALEVKQYNIIIHTNASLRNETYFKKLATVLKKHKEHLVRFSIDGMEDTNHIYRQGSNWKKIMANTRAFISEQGRAMWQYLIFPWNQHQADEARALSKQMGFAMFQQRHDRSLVTKIGLDNIKNKKLLDNKISIGPRSIENYLREIESKVNETILCNTLEQKMYFVGHNGRIWPCCFIHNGFFHTDTTKVNFINERLLNVYNDPDWNNANIKPIAEIINHKFYSEDLVDSWNSRCHGTGSKDRIHRCTEVCSQSTITKLPIGKFKIEVINK